MASYCMGLFGCCLLCGLCRLMAPDGAFQRYLRLIGGLCVLCVLLSPLPSWLKQLSSEEVVLDWLGEEMETSNYDEIYKNALAEMSGNEIRSYVEERLTTDFSLGEDELTLQIEWKGFSDDALTAERAMLFLRGRAVLCDPDALKTAVTLYLQCPCEIRYD